MPGGIHPPNDVIASWPPANLTNPTLRDHTYIIVIGTVLGVATVTVGARLWARGVIQRSFAFEDWLIIGALLCTISIGTCASLGMAKYGFDRHVWDAFILADRLESGRKTVLAMEFSYILGTGLTKLSILFFVLRMTKRSSNKWILISVWSTIVFCTLSTLVFFAVPFADCHPFSAFWHQVNYKWILAGTPYKCLDEGARIVVAGVIAVIQDIIVASLPLSTVWGLQLPMRKKIAITAIFGGGYLSCGFGVMRLYYTYKVFYQTYDVTWEAPNMFIWTNLELQVALICASIPALKVFLKHYRESTFGSKVSYSLGKYRGSKSSSSNNNNPRSPQGPGFYTQALASDIQKSTHITMERSGTISFEPRRGSMDFLEPDFSGRRLNPSPV